MKLTELIKRSMKYIIGFLFLIFLIFFGESIYSFANTSRKTIITAAIMTAVLEIGAVIFFYERHCKKKFKFKRDLLIFAFIIFVVAIQCTRMVDVTVNTNMILNYQYEISQKLNSDEFVIKALKSEDKKQLYINEVMKILVNKNYNIDLITIDVDFIGEKTVINFCDSKFNFWCYKPHGIDIITKRI